MTALDIPSDHDILQSDVERIYDLNAFGYGITSLKGIETLVNLSNLILDDNEITDLSPLKDLQSLVAISLEGNPISDLSALKNLANLQILDVSGTDITDLSVLLEFPSLRNVQSTRHLN